MTNQRAEPITSIETANERISWISGYETEVEVQDAARQIVAYFGMDAFVFGALSRSGEREHHRYLVGCAPEWCYAYTQNKWYAIDPFIEYALQNTAPAIISDIEIRTAGQRRMFDVAAEYGYVDGVIVPAHSSSSMWVGILYLTTAAGRDKVQAMFNTHRSLMRAFALELLEWWDTRIYETSATELDIDDTDIELLTKAWENASTDEVANEVGLPSTRVRWRYDRLKKKMGVSSRREAAEKAVALGLIKPAYAERTH